MSADEMFEKLGYKKVTKNYFNYLEYTKKENEDIDLVISFNGKSKTIMGAIYERGNPRARALAFLADELAAINKKVKEMKWE